MSASRKRSLVLLAVLMAAAFVFAGCFQVTYFDLPSGVPVRSDYTITVQVKPLIDGSISPTVAMRVPTAWDVQSVEMTGPAGRMFHYSPSITAYFTNTWQTKPADISHNGAKPGYKWWAGYAAATDLLTTDIITLTVVIDTRGGAGTYYLDFVSGMTDPAAPENQTTNANGANWELGGMGETPQGVRLDQMVTLTATSASFRDVPLGHAYFDAIESMYAAGVINGYDVPGGKEFRPQNDVWRWQFAKMICGQLSLTVNEALVAPYNDLGTDPADTLEPHDYVAAASLNNIIKGYPDGSFRAYTSVSRAQVMSMVVRAMNNLSPGVLETPPAGYNMSVPSFDVEHTQNLRIAQYNGLTTGLQGYGASWDPWASMSRGEVAQVLYNTNLID